VEEKLTEMVEPLLAAERCQNGFANDDESLGRAQYKDL
jgi:hypothetical protein